MRRRWWDWRLKFSQSAGVLFAWPRSSFLPAGRTGVPTECDGVRASQLFSQASQRLPAKSGGHVLYDRKATEGRRARRDIRSMHQAIPPAHRFREYAECMQRAQRCYDANRYPRADEECVMICAMLPYCCHVLFQRFDSARENASLTARLAVILPLIRAAIVICARLSADMPRSEARLRECWLLQRCLPLRFTQKLCGATC